MKRFFLFLAALAILQVPAYAEGDKVSCSETAMQYEVTGGRLKRNSDEVLSSQYGTTVEQVVEECASIIPEVNQLL